MRDSVPIWPYKNALHPTICLRPAGERQSGKLADLVLLDANPVEDIHNTTRMSAVAVNGQFLDRKHLDQMLVEVESAAKRK
jgi:hypothetical protein